MKKWDFFKQKKGQIKTKQILLGYVNTQKNVCPTVAKHLFVFLVIFVVKILCLCYFE
jgi:hypothetical protein